jgi:hypothetical protein
VEGPNFGGGAGGSGSQSTGMAGVYTGSQSPIVARDTFRSFSCGRLRALLYIRGGGGK